MENPRPEKVAVVDEVRERLSGAPAALLTEYRGLKVAELAALRQALREAGGEYKVYKNTLVRFAARDLGLELEELLTGPTGIAFATEDAVGVARVLRDFGRTNPALVVKGGVLGTAPLTAEQARALADVPPREVLLARFAGGLAAPLQQFAGLLQALPRNFAYGLAALIDAKGGPEPAPADTPEAEPEPAADTAPPDPVAAGPEPGPVPAEPEPTADTAPSEPTDTPQEA
ncbi:MAG: 50S ribosomal protein L10 [Acidimicrobiia bacterium]|nr:50S ribosomal protein L10 [Acidimicrobiia bacterium]